MIRIPPYIDTYFIRSMKNLSLLFIFTFSVLWTSCHTRRASMAGVTFDTMAVMDMDSSLLGYVSPLNNVNLQMDLYYSEVTFHGFSNWEQWGLKIYSDSLIELKTETLGIYSFNAVSTTISEDATMLYYSCVNQQKESINITIRKQPACEDELGAVDYPFAVLIVLKKADGTELNYSGCGFYIINPLLNDVWALDSIKGKSIDRAAYANGVPSLEFHLDGMKVHGFGGCNEISGSFYVDREDKLIFSSMLATLKMCASMEGEITVLNALNNKAYRYTIENGKLRFIHKDGSVLIFKKVD